MSDSENERKPDSQEAPSVMTPETLRESLDELAKNVDDLVDRLTMDMTDSPVDEKRSKQPAAPPGAPGTQAPPATTPPSSPVQDEPPPAAALASDVSAEAPATPPAALDEDLVPPGSIDEDLEIMGLAGDVVDSVAGAEPEAVEEEVPAAESVEPEATAETFDSPTMSVADRIDAELAKTAELTDDSVTAAEADDFMAMETPEEPPSLEGTAADHEEALPSFEPEPPAPEEEAASLEEVSPPAEPELPAVEAHDAEAATEPPEALDLDVQKEIDAIDAGLDSLFAQDEVETDAKAKEQETLKLADGPQAESAVQGIELAVGPEQTTAPDTTQAAGQTSRLKKPARADVVPWSAPPSPRRQSRGASRTWRLVAAMLFLGAVGGGAWVLLSTEEPPTIDFQLAASGGADRDSGDATSRTAGTAIPFMPASSGDGAPQGDSPPPDEPAATQPETPPAPEAPAAAPAPKKPALSPPRAETPKPAAAKTPPPAPAKKPSSKIATKPTPTPPPARKETKPVNTEPKPAVKSTPSDTPKVADARPVATPVTTPKPASPEKTAETVTTRPEPATASETPSGTPSAAPVATNVDRDPPAPVEQPKPAPPEPTPRPRPAAGPTGPAEPAADLVPPQLVTRQEPIYPPRARKRGEGGVVELKVLVNEQGRVVRVVVEQGLPGSELEARAIDAALRSTYRPATEAGRPVRAWVTERFVFEP